VRSAGGQRGGMQGRNPMGSADNRLPDTNQPACEGSGRFIRSQKVHDLLLKEQEHAGQRLGVALRRTPLARATGHSRAASSATTITKSRHCSLQEKSPPEALPSRQSDGVAVAKIPRFVPSRDTSQCSFYCINVWVCTIELGASFGNLSLLLKSWETKVSRAVDASGVCGQKPGG
jgi:hypothetical protein